MNATMTIDENADAGDERLLDLERQRLEAKAQRLNATADGPEDERLYDVIGDLEEEIAKAPAHTVAGVAVKIRLLHENHERGRDRLTCDADGLRTALEALERLGGASQDDAEVHALHAPWQKAQKATIDASDRAQNAKEKGQPNENELWELTEKIVGDETAAYNRFLTAPARTAPGMLLKLDAWMNAQEEDPDPAAPLAVMRDLKRLVGWRATTSEADPVLVLCVKHRKAWEKVHSLDVNDALSSGAADAADKIALEIANTAARTIDGVLAQARLLSQWAESVGWRDARMAMIGHYILEGLKFVVRDDYQENDLGGAAVRE